jgi:hypothetical protein
MVTAIAVFIFLLCYMLVRKRLTRRVSLGKEERFIDRASFAFVVIGFVYTILHDYGFTPSFLEPYYSLIIVIVFSLAIFSVGLLVVKKNTKQTTLGNPNFNHLTIHYSHRDDTPDTINASRPYYVSFKNQAYWVTDEIVLHSQQHDIAHWYSYDGERKLRKSLDAQGININDRAPTSDELNLWRKPNGDLIVAQTNIDLETFSKLKQLNKEGKFKTIELAVIYPWRCFTRKSMWQVYPSDKAVIVDHSTKPKNARPAPYEWSELYYRGTIVHIGTYRKIVPFIPLRIWCWLYGFKFDRTPFEMPNLLSYGNTQSSEAKF